MLTPLDIQNAVFHRSLRGYNEAEVDEFLDRVVVEYEQLYRENLALRGQRSGQAEVAAVAEVEQRAPASPAVSEALEGLGQELSRLKAAVQEETRRLESLRRQRRLFAAQFEAMLEAYRTMLAEQGGGVEALAREDE